MLGRTYLPVCLDVFLDYLYFFISSFFHLFFANNFLAVPKQKLVLKIGFEAIILYFFFSICHLCSFILFLYLLLSITITCSFRFLQHSFFPLFFLSTLSLTFYILNNLTLLISVQRWNQDCHRFLNRFCWLMIKHSDLSSLVFCLPLFNFMYIFAN